MFVFVRILGSCNILQPSEVENKNRSAMVTDGCFHSVFLSFSTASRNLTRSLWVLPHAGFQRWSLLSFLPGCTAQPTTLFRVGNVQAVVDSRSFAQQHLDVTSYEWNLEQFYFTGLIAFCLLCVQEGTKSCGTNEYLVTRGWQDSCCKAPLTVKKEKQNSLRRREWLCCF